MDDDALARLDTIGLSIHQAVTLASIVEREAQAASERPLIAGVFCAACLSIAALSHVQRWNMHWASTKSA